MTGQRSPPDPGRTGMAIRTSLDGGLSWPNKTVVWAMEADYSSLVVMAEGKIGLLYTRNHSLETVFQILADFAV